MTVNYSLTIQTFSKLIEEDRIYVDKTDLIYDLVRKGSGQAYFFSRPRRFGKSLLISTLKSIFEGKQELFKGLFIYDKIEWLAYPIIHLSMTDIDFVRWGLQEALKMECESIAKSHGLSLPNQKSPLKELLEVLYEKYQQKVVILIDEYDRPITYGLDKEDSSIAEENRDILKGFYSGLKDADNYLRFLFITGITKFSTCIERSRNEVSIFSDLNHLNDITLNERFVNLCGYTQTELEKYFPVGLAKLAETRKMSPEKCLLKIKEWYDGFSWDGENFVYNPYSILRLLESSQFSNYWFETGTPTFLVKMLNEKIDYQLENIKVLPLNFSTFNLRNLEIHTLLLQTGYLSIKKRFETDGEVDYYLVGLSNKECRESFNQMLLADYTGNYISETGISIYEIRTAFIQNDLPQAIKIIETMFATIPAHLFSRQQANGKKVGNGENFYHAIIYLVFNLLGVKMQAEVAVRAGRIDAVVETKECIYIFEFKKNQQPEIAIQQILDRKYPEKYALYQKEIQLVGVSFSLRKRGIDKWKQVLYETKNIHN